MIAPLKLLQSATPVLQQSGALWAVAGGLSASFYRHRPRLTNDVDIALHKGDLVGSKELAISVIKELGLTSSLGWIATHRVSAEVNNTEVDGTGAAKSTRNKPASKHPIALVIGHLGQDSYNSSIDFLLPSLEWVPEAVKRAQFNLIDYRFAKLPTITPEDLLVAKCYALKREPNRFQDLDDIQSIFQAKLELDLPFIISELERLSLKFPDAVRQSLPSALKRRTR